MMAFAEIETNFRKPSPIKLKDPSWAESDLDANNGVDEIVEAQRPFALKHHVSFGDLYVHRYSKSPSLTHCPTASSSPVLLVSPTALVVLACSSSLDALTSLVRLPISLSPNLLIPRTRSLLEWATPVSLRMRLLISSFPTALLPKTTSIQPYRFLFSLLSSHRFIDRTW